MNKLNKSVLQEWVGDLSMMQQTVLLTAIRGPDGLPKYGPVKMLTRWFRRCILYSAMDGKIFTDPQERGGGSFTGPSVTYVAGDDSGLWEPLMDEVVDGFMQLEDTIPHHFYLHLVHAVEILGYKHPDKRIRFWWNGLYLRLVHAFHLHPEAESELDARLGDSEAGWRARADRATTT